MNTMRAIVKNQPTKGLWAADVPIPEPKKGEVRVKIKKTAICGTDLHIYNYNSWAQKTLPLPLTVGHEYSGVVEKLGEDVTRLKIGDRVTGEGHVPCGECDLCRQGREFLCGKTKAIGITLNGAFAEYLVLPARNLLILDDSISDDEGAILDPLGNAVSTALAYSPTAKDVLITGAGPIGIMAAKVAKFSGARSVVITDINPTRLAFAEKLAGVLTLDVSKHPISDAKKLAKIENAGFELALETSGSPKALNDMIGELNPGADIAILGVIPSGSPIDWEKIVFRGLQLKGIYGREMFKTWYQLFAMLHSGFDIKSFVTHRLPASEFQKGFDLALSGEAVKVVFDWES